MNARGEPLPSTTHEDWLAVARALAPIIEAGATRGEKERRIAPGVLRAMQEAGLFHLLLPTSLRGAAADILTFNRVVETIAMADASPAWCLAQAVGSSH